MSQVPEGSRAPLTTAKASLREVERRRGDRLLITMPIRVEGVDREGEKFTEDSRTLVINRQGARIYLKQAVAAGSVVSISTAGGRRTAKFRVVGATQAASGEGGEWGVECLESNCTVWGIGFPPNASADGMCAALLECQRCHAAKLIHLSLIEHEVLGTSGRLVKECEDCGRLTSWGYRDTSLPIPGNGGGEALPGPGSLPEQLPAAGRRMQNRVALQLPMRVRSFRGTEEFTRTENVSRDGACFITNQNYDVGEYILVTCPFEAGGHNIEVRSQVVRRNEMQGTGRKIYGICYER